MLNLNNPMSQLPSANQSSPHADPSAVPAAEPGFEVFVQEFWNKNRSIILVLCGLLLLGVICREGWQYFSAMREQTLQNEYAQISDKPERLVGFAEANAGHPLAAVAYLQYADAKFEAADYSKAGTYYTKAAGSLKNEALVGRAKLGAALSSLNSGDIAGGETALKSISADQALPTAVRSEATYHLASLAAEAGKSEEVTRLVAEITKIDLGGPWSQRATMLLSRIPADNKAAAPALFK